MAVTHPDTGAVTVGVAGKGGAGKTTVVANVARILAQRGRRVLAIDGDSDPHLALSSGLSPEEATTLPPLLDQSGDDRHLPAGMPARALLDDYAVAGPDGVRLLLGARAERAGSG